MTPIWLCHVGSSNSYASIDAVDDALFCDSAVQSCTTLRLARHRLSWFCRPPPLFNPLTRRMLFGNVVYSTSEAILCSATVGLPRVYFLPSLRFPLIRDDAFHFSPVEGVEGCVWVESKFEFNSTYIKDEQVD